MNETATVSGFAKNMFAKDNNDDDDGDNDDDDDDYDDRSFSTYVIYRCQHMFMKKRENANRERETPSSTPKLSFWRVSYSYSLNFVCQVYTNNIYNNTHARIDPYTASNYHYLYKTCLSKRVVQIRDCDDTMTLLMIFKINKFCLRCHRGI